MTFWLVRDGGEWIACTLRHAINLLDTRVLFGRHTAKINLTYARIENAIYIEISLFTTLSSHFSEILELLYNSPYEDDSGVT